MWCSEIEIETRFSSFIEFGRAEIGSLCLCSFFVALSFVGLWACVLSVYCSDAGCVSWQKVGHREV